MADLSFLDDTYNLRARVAPALVAVLPIGLMLSAWWPGELKWSATAGLVVTLTIGSLLSHLGRDFGKGKEPDLFKRWDGKPTTQLLSLRASTFNPLTLARYHSVLRTARPDLRLPRSLEDELRDPIGADNAYDSCTDYLRELARDRKKHPVLFEENVSYGFRRNLWAMKAPAISLCVLAIAALLPKALGFATATHEIDWLALGFLGATWCLLFLWIVIVTPSWVRVVAFAYAERLLAICEVLEAKRQTSSGIILSGE